MFCNNVYSIHNEHCTCEGLEWEPRELSHSLSEQSRVEVTTHVLEPGRLPWILAECPQASVWTSLGLGSSVKEDNNDPL